MSRFSESISTIFGTASSRACSNVLGDVCRDRRRGENNRGRRIGQDRTYPLMSRAAVRQRERNRDQPGLHGSQECGNVIEALGSQDDCSVSGRPMEAELACHIQCSAG